MSIAINIKKARWRTNQHPVHGFEVFFLIPRRSTFFCFERIVFKDVKYFEEKSIT
jgi:hypothetical protein